MYAINCKPTSKITKQRVMPTTKKKMESQKLTRESRKKENKNHENHIIR